MLVKSLPISDEDRRRMGGNAQISFRLPPEWLAAMEALALDGEDAQAIVKALIHPALSRIVTVERDDETGKVIAITGLDAHRRKVTIRCDGPPVVKGAVPLADPPKRGRPPKTPRKKG